MYNTFFILNAQTKPRYTMLNVERWDISKKKNFDGCVKYETPRN